MSKVGVVGIPGGWSSQRLVSALEGRGCQAHLIDMEHLIIDLDSGIARCDGIDLNTLDALVIKKIGSPYRPELLDRLALLRHIAGNGVSIFSDPLNVKRVINRLSCTITLRLAGIPMPPTVITEDVDGAAQAVERFGRAVLKPLYTSKARGMVVVEAGAGARGVVERFKAAGNPMIYVQRMLDLPGHDLGLAFLGGRFLGCYARVGNGESWNTTTHDGGRYEPFDPDDETIELAHRAQAAFGLDFTCVDAARAEDGLIIFEVSAFGGFRGLWEARQLDAAQRYADYVLTRIGHE